MPPVVDPRPLRWLIAAPLCAAPTGRRITVSGERFTTVMNSLSPTAAAEVADRFGADSTRTLSLQFGRPRDFRVRDVVGKIELLSQLSSIVERLAKDGDTQAALQQIRTTVGEGRWVDTVHGRAPAPPVAAPATTPDSGAGAGGRAAPQPDDSDDPIFGKASVQADPQRVAADAKSAVGSFISAMRSGDHPAPAPTSGRACAKTLRETLHACARELLTAPPVARLESAWRSLRMVMAACPSADDLGVDALDIDPQTLVSALAGPLTADAWQRPDAVFVAETIDDPAVLSALADLADAARVPIVVQIPPHAVGFDADGQTLGDCPEAWAGLRGLDSAGWLCAVVGAPVLLHETDGGPRTVFGSGPVAIAAMVATSVASSGAPAAIVGKSGALVAPAAHSVPHGAENHTIPTREFINYRTQQALAQRGVTAIGSESGSDQLRLAAAPMVAGDMALPGRILAGRAHRLAVAVREQLGPAATHSELARALQEASGAFLPNVGGRDVTLRLRTIGADGAQVDASIGAVLAGSAVSFSSEV